MIQQGQTLPSATLSELTDEGMQNHSTEELFANKKVVLLQYQAHLHQRVLKPTYPAMSF